MGVLSVSDGRSLIHGEGSVCTLQEFYRLCKLCTPGYVLSTMQKGLRTCATFLDEATDVVEVGKKEQIIVRATVTSVMRRIDARPL